MQSKSVKFSFLFIVLPLILPGLLVATWRLIFRTVAEQKNIYVETVVDFEEMRQLSREEGWKLKDLCSAMKKSGVSSVAISEDTLASLESEGRITVLSAKEIRKLSLDQGFQHELPVELASPGGLWIHAEDSALLDRIEQHLSWRLDSSKIIRLHRNFLLVNKSARGFRERVGLGFSNEYFDLAHAAGLGLVVRVFNYPGLNATDSARIINAIPSPASVSALLFAEEEMLGNRGDLKGIIEIFKNRSYRIGWVEFNTQEGIEAYLHGLSGSRPFVRVHSIGRKEIDQNYNADRAVARWIRAVKDRSMKMLYIRCFFQDDQRYISDLVQFNLNYIKRIEKGLNEAGFVVAADVSQRLNEPRHIVGYMSAAEKIAIALALLLGLPLLVKFSFVPDLDERWFFAVAILTILGFFATGNETFVGVCGLAGAFSFASLGVILAFSSLEKIEQKISVVALIKFFGLLVAPSIIGGILVAGLYSEIEYLLKFEQFRGIKLAFILPVIWVLIWSLRQYGHGILNVMNQPLTPLMGFLGIAVASAFALYLLRSGNLTIVKPSALEDSFRTFLENTLVARPRNKEFLIGYPAAALFIFFYFRRCMAILPLIAVFVQMGQVSVVNTLCHFHSPLTLSLLRIVNGLWLGLAVALPTVVFAAIFWLIMLAGSPERRKVILAGYIGFGNYGDELLWQVFVRRLEKAGRNLEPVILSAKNSDAMGETRVILRCNWYDQLETMAVARALIFPGGGILQSTTSIGSLIYYMWLILLAKIFGLKVILPAQGIGPWGGNEKRFPRLFRIFARLIQSIDYLTVRDVESQKCIKDLAEIDVPVSADLAFLENQESGRRIGPATANLRMAVVLRSSVPESESICRTIIEIAEEMENLKVIPVAMQPEDTHIWQNCGWKETVTHVSASDRLFNDVDLVVSMRLHGCIVACVRAIPWVGIAYDPKVAGFAQACSWKHCFNPDQINKKLLEEQINLLATKKVEFSEKLARRANEMSRRAEADFNAVIARLED
ncbi:MAG: DUF5693 family protein [Candidatus Rifleibacteriota bacterium]